MNTAPRRTAIQGRRLLRALLAPSAPGVSTRRPSSGAGYCKGPRFSIFVRVVLSERL